MTVNSEKIAVTIVIPTFNERENIIPLLKKFLSCQDCWDLELLVVDDDSSDGTAIAVKKLAFDEKKIRLIHRIGRCGLASAIKEGLFAATNNIAAVMDADGQHDIDEVLKGITKLKEENLDVVNGSRFIYGAKLQGLSKNRQSGSTVANDFARFSLSRNYQHITDYMSGCLVFKLNSCLPYIRKIDVNGFKFFYELLAVSKGNLKVAEIPLTFQPRQYGSSKLDISIVWDFIISLLHSLSFRILPRRAISFGLVGATGVLVQLVSTETMMEIIKMPFRNALPIAVLIAATSNYLVNNALTFRSVRLKRWSLFKGLMKFLLVSSLPVIANVGLATTFYSVIAENTFWAQISGILLVFIWNYAASSRIVWNTP